MTNWLAALEPVAPDIVLAYNGIEEERFLSVRREVRRRAGTGSASRVLGQLEALADALATVVQTLPDSAFSLPGGEDDWTVAQAIGHAARARAFLVVAAGMSASGRWPADAPQVIPGIPGPADADRTDLLRKLAQSQRIIARSAVQVAGHETEPCPLDHPLVGRLRCGEWLLFAGVHDLMHLAQLHDIAERLNAVHGPV